jgi:uncharacterized membrane protein YccC
LGGKRHDDRVTDRTFGKDWGLGVLIGLGALVMAFLGRPGDTITTGIATAVVMVVAAVSPHDAWQQPILRWIDTIIGLAVGVAAGWIVVRATHDHHRAVARA